MILPGERVDTRPLKRLSPQDFSSATNKKISNEGLHLQIHIRPLNLGRGYQNSRDDQDRDLVFFTNQSRRILILLL